MTSVGCCNRIAAMRIAHTVLHILIVASIFPTTNVNTCVQLDIVCPPNLIANPELLLHHFVIGIAGPSSPILSNLFVLLVILLIRFALPMTLLLRLRPDVRLDAFSVTGQTLFDQVPAPLVPERL